MPTDLGISRSLPEPSRGPRAALHVPICGFVAACRNRQPSAGVRGARRPSTYLDTPSRFVSHLSMSLSVFACTQYRSRYWKMTNHISSELHGRVCREIVQFIAITGSISSRSRMEPWEKSRGREATHRDPRSEGLSSHRSATVGGLVDGVVGQDGHAGGELRFGLALGVTDDCGEGCEETRRRFEVSAFAKRWCDVDLDKKIRLG